MITMLHAPRRIAFDPSQEEHRKAASKYVLDRKWDPSFPMFILEAPYMNLDALVKTRLLEYYCGSEFSQVEQQEMFTNAK